MGTSTDPGSLAEILASLGAAGRRLDEIGAAEAGAGNMSVAVAGMLDLADTFQQSRDIDLPIAVPALAGHTILVTGSGCRLRSVADDPLGNVGAVVVHDGGRTGTVAVCDTLPRKSVPPEQETGVVPEYEAVTVAEWKPTGTAKDPNVPESGPESLLPPTEADHELPEIVPLPDGLMR